MELGNGGLVEQLRQKATESEADDATLDAIPQAEEPEVVEPEITEPEAVEPEEVAAVEPEADLEPAEYEPNYNFKVHDDVKEFDEFVRPLIKSKEDEEKVRDLYERAHGLDLVKQDRQVLRDDNKGMASQLQEYGVVKKDLARLGDFLKQGDMESFLEAHQINDDQVFQYAMQKLRMAEDPDMLNNYNAQRQNQLVQYDKDQELAALRSETQNYAYERKANELNFSLSDPMVQQAETEYNSRMGENAFRNEVIARGQMHYRNTQQDLSASDAVNQVMSVMGYSQGQAETPQQPQYGTTPQYVAPQGRAPMQGQQRGKPKVIPNIRGRSSTPVKKMPKSIQDLRNLSNEMNG